MRNTTRSILKNVYTTRTPEVKKYDFGLLVVIGGSELYSGAPALAALAGFRAGADVVRIIAPRRAADMAASFSPILATWPLHGDHLATEHLSLLLSRTNDAKEVAHGRVAVVIGSGLGRSEETQDTVREYLSQIDVPVVLDADAIHAVAKHSEVLKGKSCVITPHRHEFMILTRKDIRDSSMEDRIKAVEREAVRLGTTILLKGAIDIISDGKEFMLNKTGSPYMSVGGTGDTLAGITGALLARGIHPLKAAAAAAFINGKAGEIAAKKLGKFV